MQPRERQQQQLHADQRKQQRIEHVIQQFPEAVHIATGHFVHGLVAAKIANNQTGYNHRNRRRHMQFTGHGRAANHQSQCQHHLDLILLDAFDHPVDQITNQPPEHHAANRFMGE